MEKYSEDFVKRFHEYLNGFKNLPELFKDEASLKNQQEKVKVWFMRLFLGEYDSYYFQWIEQISRVYVKV
ncbi:MAG: protoglobin domain-containing protein [Bacillota bacterium]